MGLAASGALSSSADELLARLAELSPAELRADIERANKYLASEEGQREFVHWLKPGPRDISGAENG